MTIKSDDQKRSGSFRRTDPSLRLSSPRAVVLTVLNVLSLVRNPLNHYLHDGKGIPVDAAVPLFHFFLFVPGPFDHLTLTHVHTSDLDKEPAYVFTLLLPEMTSGEKPFGRC